MLEILSDSLVCGRCGKVMAKVTREEFDGITQGDDWSGLCFDCDPESAATTPSIFWQWAEGDLIDIGDLGFQVRDGLIRVIGVSRAHTHERTRPPVSSSYTYLNETPKNTQFWREGWEVRFCQECMSNPEQWDFNERRACVFCGGTGGEIIALYIPRWVVSLAVADV